MHCSQKHKQKNEHKPEKKRRKMRNKALHTHNKQEKRWKEMEVERMMGLG